MKGKCIYCKKKGTSKEHAFPESLLHKCAPLGKYAPNWIIRQLCEDCNSSLGKLDEILATRSAMADIWRRIKNEWEPNKTGKESKFYNTKSHGMNPVRLFYSTPLYENLIVLHEETGASVPGFHPTPISSIQAPQIILTQYTEDQTGEKIRTENCEKWNAGETPITEFEEHEGVYCFFGNTYIFAPDATWYFVSNPDREQEFRSKFLKKRNHIRCDLHFIFSEESKDADKFNRFLECLGSTGTKEQIEMAHLEQTVFEHLKKVVADRKSKSYIYRAVAKIAFHSFLYHHRQFSGHEPIFNNIKAFIEGKADSHGETGEEFVTGVKVTEDYISDSNDHFHILRFYVNGDNIVCHIAFFTGLLVGPYASAITLAGDRDKAMPDFCQEVFIPFYVHAKSELLRRIVPVRF